MEKIKVVYWTQGGNTAAMADAIGKGIAQAGKEAVVADISTIPAEDLKNDAVFAMGCPAMGNEVLEEAEMEPYVMEVESFAAGKTIALFGSYGWGDGQWMRDWVDRMEAAGAKIVDGEGCICQDTPDDETIDTLIALGKQLAAL